MSTMKTLARNLLRSREQRGLTLTGLAERCGIAKSTLSTLESGEGNPTVETLWAIANALDIPFGLLVSGTDVGENSLAAELEGNGSTVRLIERSDGDPEIEVYSVELKAGYRQESAPHPAGVRERVTVLSGAMLVGDPERPKLVRVGESCAFAADVPHVYGATDRGTKALVLIEYPPRDTTGGRSVIHLDWPSNASDWDGVRSVVDRLLIEVANGVDARLVRFRGCKLAAKAARNELRKQLNKNSSRRFSWPLLSLADADRQGAYLVVLPLRFAAAFSQPDNPALPAPGSALSAARDLARLAESPFLPLADGAMKRAKEAVSSSSWVLSALASEVLIQRGLLVLPSQLGHLAQRANQPRRVADDRSFSSRIDVDHYDAFELLHPAYARQVVALAEDIEAYAAVQDPLHAIDVGTGPGVPLLMLHDLRPRLQITAIEPDDTAFACLQENIRGISGITAHQTGFLELDFPEGETPLITSVGASHHFNTAFMLQKSMLVLKPGGILCIADEFLPEFHTPEERSLALLRHHAAYILAAVAWMGRCELVETDDEDWGWYRAFQQALALALVEAESGQGSAAIGRCRELYATMKKASLEKVPGHAIGAYTRFFWLELQAMVAGFDYEIERKTYPRRFADLARLAGFELLRHRRVFATTGADEWGGGTHVFAFRKPVVG